MSDHRAYRKSEPTGPVVPVVLDSPHSGFEYPQDFLPGVPMQALRQAEDSYVDELFSCGPKYGATLIAARFPRAYIDPNRSLLDIDPALLASPWPGPAVASRKTELGIGLIWRVLDSGVPIYSRKLTIEEVKRRITEYHQPYQKALKDAMDAAHRHFGAVWHMNCHSMPATSSKISEEGPGRARADFVLGDRDGTTCDPEFTSFVAAFLVGLGHEVKVNDPYKGVELVRAFSDPQAGRHSLQIEVNRRLYMNESTRERTEGFGQLALHVENLVRAVCAYAAERGSHHCAGHEDHSHDHDHSHHGHGQAHDHEPHHHGHDHERHHNEHDHSHPHGKHGYGTDPHDH